MEALTEGQEAPSAPKVQGSSPDPWAAAPLEGPQRALPKEVEGSSLPGAAGGGAASPTSGGLVFAAGMGGVEVPMGPWLQALGPSAYRLLAAEVAKVEWQLLQEGQVDQKVIRRGAELQGNEVIRFSRVPPGSVRIRAQAFSSSEAWVGEASASGTVHVAQFLALAPQSRHSLSAVDPSATGNLQPSLALEEGPLPEGRLLNAWRLPQVVALQAWAEEEVVVARTMQSQGGIGVSYEHWGPEGRRKVLWWDGGTNRPLLALGPTAIAMGRQGRLFPESSANPPWGDSLALAWSTEGVLGSLGPGAKLRRWRPGPGSTLPDLEASGESLTAADAGGWWVGGGSTAYRVGGPGPLAIELPWAPQALEADGQGGFWLWSGQGHEHRNAHGQGLAAGQAWRHLSVDAKWQVWGAGDRLVRLAPGGQVLAQHPFAGDLVSGGRSRLWHHGQGVLRLLANTP